VGYEVNGTHTMRLIQDSAIDLARPILSCNDQPLIKIAE
jgi:hypothetical protein